MKSYSFRNLPGALIAMAMLAIVAVACSGSSPFQSPTGPTGIAATTASSSAVSGAMEDGPAPCPAVSGTTQDTPEPEPEPCEPPPPPPPPGIPCSPGYWKNHETEFQASCGAAAALATNTRLDSCGELLTALTCRGSDASCLRSAAAGLLNEVSGCTED